MKHLLDVNVLIAAVWTTHVDHAKADAWLKGKKLGTCPISQMGFLRISTHPRALGADMVTARKLLEDFEQKHAVEFVPADLPALKANPVKSDLVTDTYLAELASANGMKLVSLDTGIKHSAVELIA